MKYGYLEFRYGNNKSKRSVNIGDNIQSIAARSLFRRLGIANDEVIGIDRDGLPNYRGEEVKLLMNGCFYDYCFPLPPQVKPIFFGFNTKDDAVIRKNKALFQGHQPIGCRDTSTKRLFERHGISAYVTGCITLTFEARVSPPVNGSPIIAFGSGAGGLPAQLLSKIPKPILERSRLIYQREPVTRLPLDNQEVARMDGLAANYLNIYKNEAEIVITPLLHVACPCIAMGIPVVVARRDSGEGRFSAVDRLIPVCTQKCLSSIEWNPTRLEIEDLKSSMVNTVKGLLEGKLSPVDLDVLRKYFDSSPILDTESSSGALSSLIGKLLPGKKPLTL